MRSRTGSLGLWAGVATAATAAVGIGVGFATPPRSGSNCTTDCIGPPYTDVAAFVPRDYLWMYGTVLALLSFVVLVVCAHNATATDRRAFSMTALCFAVIAASTGVVAYAVQLMVVQPALLDGQEDGLSLWSMYNPHGVFLALENVTYFLAGLSFVFLAAALPTGRGVVRAIRIVLVVAGGLAVVTLPLLAAVYRSDLGYRYEVVSISVVLVGLVAIGVLCAVAFRRGLLSPRG